MTMHQATYESAAAARFGAIEALQAAKSAGRRPVLIAPDATRCLRFKRLLAGHGNGFGVWVTTIGSLIEDAWGLYGDSRSIIDSITRTAALQAALEAQHELSATPGMLHLLQACAQTDIDAMQATPSMCEDERAAIGVLQTYAAMIARRNNIESCQAARALTSIPDVLRYAPVLLEVDIAGLSPAQRELMDYLDAVAAIDGMQAPPDQERSTELTNLQRLIFKRGAQDEAIAPTGSLRCALSSGPTAQQRIITDCINEELTQGADAACDFDVVIASKDPARYFEFARPLLDKLGVAACLQTRVSVRSTDAGRALAQLVNLKEDEVDALEAADFARNPFSGIAPSDAFDIDRANRKNRFVKPDTVRFRLSEKAEDGMRKTVSFFRNGQYDKALDSFHTFLDDHRSDQPAYRALQLRVTSKARSAFAAAKEYGLDAHHAMQAIAQTSVSYTCETAPNPRVAFMSLHDAAALEDACARTVIITDLNVDTYPVAAKGNAARGLMESCGIADETDLLNNMRSDLYHTLCAARQRVIIHRSLNDSQADPAQAATLFEEIIDCYRPDVTSTAGCDDFTGLPESLLDFCTQAGEERLAENASCAFDADLHDETLPPLGDITPEARKLIVLPRTGTGPDTGMNLSASQIESYLECPYNWFAKRRMRIEGLDEQYGPMERGLFVHDVLAQFYADLKKHGFDKVTAESMPIARETMKHAFEDQKLRHADTKHPGPGRRYAPINVLEERQREDLLPLLLDSLDLEARLLPGWHVLEEEWGYGEVQPFSYAGCDLCGRIDRIDVDGHGHAIVIDYKSSLGNVYRLHGSEDDDAFALPLRMQTLIYAKAVRDLLGLNVVGALYVNLVGQDIQGAYDARVVGPQDIPFTSKKDALLNAVPFADITSFDELIDRCEEEVALHMQRLASGDIAPNPANDYACRHCPVDLCPRRLADREV